MAALAAAAGSVGFSWKASLPWMRVSCAGSRPLRFVYPFGQVSTVIEPPALVRVVKRAGLGDAISAHTSSELENVPGSTVPSIRSYIVQLWMKLTRSVRKFGSWKATLPVSRMRRLPNIRPFFS